MRRAFLVAAMVVSCTHHETRVDHTYDSYAGPPAYPNVRAKVALPANDFALVPSSGSDRLTVVDLAAGKAIADAPVERNPFVLDGPHQIAADMQKRVGYVVHAYPDTVESAGNHSHGSSRRSGWVQAVALDDRHPRGDASGRIFPGGSLAGVASRRSFWGGQRVDLLEWINDCRHAATARTARFMGWPGIAQVVHPPFSSASRKRHAFRSYTRRRTLRACSPAA